MINPFSDLDTPLLAAGSFIDGLSTGGQAILTTDELIPNGTRVMTDEGWHLFFFGQNPTIITGCERGSSVAFRGIGVIMNHLEEMNLMKGTGQTRYKGE